MDGKAGITSRAGGGDDYLSGEDGDDTLDGGDGDDILIGGRGNNTIRGGAGTDTVVYDDCSVHVTLSDTGSSTAEMMTLQASLWLKLMSLFYSNDRDTLFDIENIWGSTKDDHITGNNQDNELFGRSGNDRLNGKGGNDNLNGGDGR